MSVSGCAVAPRGGIGREPLMQIRHPIDRYLATCAGDIKKPNPPLTCFRLGRGDYWVFIGRKDGNSIEITGVRNGREAWR